MNVTKLFLRSCVRLSLCIWIAGAGCLLQAQNPLTNFNNHSIVACGGKHGLIIRSDGTLWGWGNDNSGQLADAPGAPGGYGWAWDPVRIPGILGAVSVAVGQNHSLILKWDGSILAFGDNSHGQLGVGDTINRHSPAVIPNLRAIAIECGQSFSVAVLTNGTVEAWGDNSGGQLGFGFKTPGTITSPTNVLRVSGIAAVACGDYHALALSSNGTVWAWGKNGSGQLGDGTTTDRPSPVAVTNLSGVMGIAAGSSLSMALTTNGTVYVWGAGGSDRLGLGSTSDKQVPTRNPSLSNIAQKRPGPLKGRA